MHSLRPSFPPLPVFLPHAGDDAAKGERTHSRASARTPRVPVVDGNNYADRAPRDGGRAPEARRTSPSSPPPPLSPRGFPPLALLPDARNPRQVAFQGSRGVALSFNYWVGQALSNQVCFLCARACVWRMYKYAYDFCWPLDSAQRTINTTTDCYTYAYIYSSRHRWELPYCWLLAH